MFFEEGDPAAEDFSHLLDASFEPPDPIDHVVEVDTMLAVFAAQRYERVESLRREALAETRVYRGAIPEIIERSLRAELAAALRITEIGADRLLSTADALVNRYPTVLDSLGGGRTTEKHALAFIDIVDPVEPELRDRVIPAGVELAEKLPLGTFRRELRSLVDTVRASTLEERHREAVSRRRVVVEPSADGMAWLSAYIPAVEARAIQNRLTDIAKVLGAEEGESRTRDQLRADTLGDLLVDGRTDAVPAAARGIRATVAITVPALTLLDPGRAPLDGPPVVEGVGPIPVERARELCGGAEGWMRVLTHPETGAVLSVGRRRYRPPPDLQRVVRWRAGRCMGVGCSRPAAACEIDHTVAWSDGGGTNLDNLAPLCAGHHTIKHHGGWQVRQVDDGRGALEWTTPSGRRYVVEPERRVPAFAPSAESDTSVSEDSDAESESESGSGEAPF